MKCVQRVPSVSLSRDTVRNSRLCTPPSVSLTVSLDTGTRGTRSVFGGSVFGGEKGQRVPSVSLGVLR